MFKIKIIFYWIQFKLRGKFSERKTIENFQRKKLQLFFERVLPLSPFYAQLIKEKNILSDFPLANKSFFMENFDELNTKSISKREAIQTALKAESDRDFSSTIKDITVGLSTGTSGKRGIFLVAEEERAQWTAMVMTRVVQPKLFKKQKVAFFLRANSNLYSSVQSALFEFRYFDIFKPIETLAKEVEKFQPDILAAQPSVLSHLAGFQKAGTIEIQPEKIISFAEVLYPEDKAFILSVFNCEFKEVYQCTEGFLGVTCEYGTMHLNEDIIFIEKKYIDEKRFYPIITDFTRTTQPIVRYELNDILVEAEDKCACGSCFTALERIEGRADDVLIFKNKEDAIIKIYPDLIARIIARTTDAFRNYKILQSSFYKMTVELNIEGEKYDSTARQFSIAILQFLQEREIINIELFFKKGITQEPGSKLRKIERTFNHEN